MTSDTYALGYRNGRHDAGMGLSLNTARHAADTEYARGYRDGHAARCKAMSDDADREMGIETCWTPRNDSKED